MVNAGDAPEPPDARDEPLVIVNTSDAPEPPHARDEPFVIVNTSDAQLAAGDAAREEPPVIVNTIAAQLADGDADVIMVTSVPLWVVSHFRAHEAVRMITNDVDDWGPQMSTTFIVRKLMETVNLFGRVLRISEGFHALGSPDTFIEGFHALGNPDRVIEGFTVRVESLERRKSPAQLSSQTLSKAGMMLVDEAVFRSLPDPHDVGYNASFQKRRRLVEVLIEHENSWLQGPEDDIERCTVATASMTEFSLFNNLTGTDEEIMQRRAFYVRRFMRSNEIIFEEFCGAFGKHY